MTTKEKVPVIYLEIVEQGNSGFYLQGTKGTPHEQQLVTPTVSWIPTEGIMVEVDEKGIKHNKPIRHIKNCELLDPKQQELAGFKPNRNADKIPFDHGFATIRREGSTVSTYDYLTKATYFANNPHRPDSATPIYKEIKVDERAVELIDEDELLTVAKSKVYALRLNTGKNTPYKYDEDKINAYCQLVNVWDETPERKLVLLLQRATQNPRAFLDTVVRAEQTIVTEISHSLQLGVTMWDGNTFQYSQENKVVTTVDAKIKATDKKIEAVASYFQTPEGNAALTELRAKLEAAKEEQFSK